MLLWLLLRRLLRRLLNWELLLQGLDLQGTGGDKRMSFPLGV